MRLKGLQGVWDSGLGAGQWIGGLVLIVLVSIRI